MPVFEQILKRQHGCHRNVSGLKQSDPFGGGALHQDFGENTIELVYIFASCGMIRETDVRGVLRLPSDLEKTLPLRSAVGHQADIAVLRAIGATVLRKDAVVTRVPDGRTKGFTG